MKFTYFLGYLFLVNLTGFLAILSDYIRSLFNFRRLPEKRYVFIAFAGGCFGVLAGIYTFKHLLTDDKRHVREWALKFCVWWVIITAVFYILSLF